MGNSSKNTESEGSAGLVVFLVCFGVIRTPSQDTTEGHGVFGCSCSHAVETTGFVSSIVTG